MKKLIAVAAVATLGFTGSASAQGETLGTGLLGLSQYTTLGIGALTLAVVLSGSSSGTTTTTTGPGS